MKRILTALLLLAATPSFAAPKPLTAADLETAFKLVEYLAGQRYSAAERAQVLAEEKKSFQKDPVEWRRVAASNAAGFSQMVNSKSAVMRENLGQTYFTNIFWLNKKTPYLIDTLIFKYRPILAVDPNTKFLLTADNVDAFLDNNEYVLKLGGFAPYSKADRSDYLKALTGAWTQLDQSSQRRIHYGRTYRAALTEMNKQMGARPDARGKVVALVKKFVKKPGEVGLLAGALELASFRALTPKAADSDFKKSMEELAALDNYNTQMGMLAAQMTQFLSSNN